MNRATRIGVAVSVAMVFGLPATTAQAESSGRLKICAYNYDKAVYVEVDGSSFARFPRDGTCQARPIGTGSHRVSTGTSGFSSGQVYRGGRNSTFYTLPITVRVDRGEETRVNLYFF